MKNSSLILVGLWLMASRLVLGQVPARQHYLAIRAGYLHASTDLTVKTSSPYPILLGGVAPRDSYYGGVFYHHSISHWLAYRTELNYQQKGIENQDQNGTTLFQQRFHYVGLTPLIGITPISGLGFFVGPEANLLIKQASLGANPKPIEFGISGRVSYRYKSIGLEAGYFKAFNEYTYLALGDARFSFKNQTWQVGMFFVPSLVKKRNPAN